MRILAVLFPRFTAIDLIGPANCWGLMPRQDDLFLDHVVRIGAQAGGLR